MDYLLYEMPWEDIKDLWVRIDAAFEKKYIYDCAMNGIDPPAQTIFLPEELKTNNPEKAKKIRSGRKLRESHQRFRQRRNKK